MYVKPTFLTVMFVLMQYKAVATLTNVRAHCVDALVLAAAVVLAALIFVCERHTCNTSSRRISRDGAEGRERSSRVQDGKKTLRQKEEEEGGNDSRGKEEEEEQTLMKHT